jgi:hypothetical protein
LCAKCRASRKYIAVHPLFGRDHAFIALERIGVVVYDISDPAAPSFVQYINVRNIAPAPGTVASGDQGAEGGWEP